MKKYLVKHLVQHLAKHLLKRLLKRLMKRVLKQASFENKKIKSSNELSPFLPTQFVFEFFSVTFWVNLYFFFIFYFSNFLIPLFINCIYRYSFFLFFISNVKRVFFCDIKIFDNKCIASNEIIKKILKTSFMVRCRWQGFVQF